jgi:hypothetical protein
MLRSFLHRFTVAWQAAKTADPDATPEMRLPLSVYLWLGINVVGFFFGFVVVGMFAYYRDNATGYVSLLLAGGCVLTGILVGFLFGIPRYLQGRAGSRTDSPQSTQTTGNAAATSPTATDDNQYRPTYGANTNLEEVSDWLTKILVGVGLTQLGNIPHKVVAFGVFFSGQLGGGDFGSRFAIAILLYFSLSGFLFGYLWTRLFLGGALVEADALTRVERKLDAQQLQAQRDAAALTLVSQQLQGTAPNDAMTREHLSDVISKASAPVKVQIFLQAQAMRRENWKEPSKIPIMERTLPVFQALADGDTEQKFHRAWGQLGYALKDKREPDYKSAEKALSTAIKIRGPVADYGLPQYEYNRAVSRIKGDENFLRGIATTDQRQREIVSDLRDASNAGLEDLIHDTDVIENWLKLNKLKMR